MLINSTYGLIIYSRNKSNGTNLLFFILTITISLWGLAMLGYRGFSDHAGVLLMSRLLYFFAIMIPTAFLYFIIVFPNPNAKLNIYQKYLAPIFPIILCILSLYPAGFINDVILYENKETFIVFNQLTHILFGLYVFIYFSWAYWILYKKYWQGDVIIKSQLVYIFIGTFSSTAITLFTNLGLLYFGYFSLNWVGQVGIIFMITFIQQIFYYNHFFLSQKWCCQNLLHNIATSFFFTINIYYIETLWITINFELVYHFFQLLFTTESIFTV